MNPSTSRTTAWTDVVVPFTATVALAATTTSVAILSRSFTEVVVALVIVTLATAVASFLPTLGGVVTGMVAAAGLVGTTQLLGRWHVIGSAPILCLVAVLVLLGVSASIAGQRVRRVVTDSRRTAAGVVRPVAGSLGTLRTTDGLARLDAEITRAQLHDRPLTLGLLELDDDGSELDADDARRARRAFLRTLTAELRSTDVPFLTEAGDLAVVMPETSPEAANDLLRSAIIAAGETTFTVREAGYRAPAQEALSTDVRVLPLASGQSGRNFLDAVHSAAPALTAPRS